MSLSARDIGEYTTFILGSSFYTIKKVSDYFVYDFPIARLNEYIYAFVLLITLAVGVKRIWGWLFKSNKTKSNDDD